MANDNSKEKNIEQLNKEILELTELVNELTAENKKLSDSLKEKTEQISSAGLLPTFEHKGKKYAFTVPKFYLPAMQTQYTAEEAAENADVIKLLVESNSPVLTKQD